MLRKLFLFLAVAVFFAGAIGYFKYTRGSGDGEQVRLEIEDANASAVADALSEQGVLTPMRASILRLVAAWSDQEFHKGIFLFPKGASVRDALAVLRQRSRAEATITIPEGSDLRDLARILGKAGLIAADEELFAVAGVPGVQGKPGSIARKDFSFLTDAPKNISVDGYLFPDTYRVFADANPEEIVRKLLATFDKRTEGIQSASKPNGLSFHEFITLASVVESEVRSAEDRRKVANIFLRRLAEGMGLQADSTVHYVAGKNSTVFTTSEERADGNPWNTYRFRGLPLGPIANPGLEAMRAVLEHEPNPYWYFLTAPDGKVHYGRTLEEHNANKKYL